MRLISHDTIMQSYFGTLLEKHFHLLVQLMTEILGLWWLVCDIYKRASLCATSSLGRISLKGPLSIAVPEIANGLKES